MITKAIIILLNKMSQARPTVPISVIHKTDETVFDRENVKTDVDSKYSLLNEDQRHSFDVILDSVYTEKRTLMLAVESVKPM